MLFSNFGHYSRGDPFAIAAPVNHPFLTAEGFGILVADCLFHTQYGESFGSIVDFSTLRPLTLYGRKQRLAGARVSPTSVRA